MVKTEPVRHIWRRVKKLLKPPLHKPEIRVRYDILGSGYGGWPVMRGSLAPHNVVYSFGIGEDITFDLGVIERYQSRVEAFDPTPRCIAWLERQSLPDQFHFHPKGLSDKATVLTFSAPPEKDYVSYTVAHREESTETITLPVFPLSDLMTQIGDKQIDLLKMDIEGSEYPVIDDLIAKQILPRQLCIEFHHGMFGYTDEQTIEAVSKLKRVGYKIYYVSDLGHEYGFLRDLDAGD